MLLEIVNGIHRVDEASKNMAHSNVYLVINDKELTVVDTGTPGNAKKTINYIQEIGRQPNEVKTIILTHFHMDHTGSLKELKVQTGAKAAASEADSEFISGKKRYPKPKNLLMRAANSFIKVEPTDIDTILKGGMRIGDLEVIETPGHTPGSIMLYDAQRKTLFAGDTLRFDGKKVSTGPKQFCWDEAKEKASIEKIVSLDFDVLLPGHGDPAMHNAASLVKEYLQTQR
jgi:glyoxylase-like metal-dependent hydrolase (beta-lactamase superfamily II)